jgi:hypothetical protein
LTVAIQPEVDDREMLFIANQQLGKTDQECFISTGFKLRLTRRTLFDSDMKHLGIVLKIPRITSVDTTLIVPMLAFAGFGSGRKWRLHLKFQPTVPGQEKD